MIGSGPMKRLSCVLLVVAACSGDSGNGGDGDGGPGGVDAVPTGPPTAFRFTDLVLKDPHIHVQVIGCMDVTGMVNDELPNSLENDGNGDGTLDFSPTIVFRPLDQARASTGLNFYYADCTAPASGTTCSPAGDVVFDTGTNTASGTC